MVCCQRNRNLACKVTKFFGTLEIGSKINGGIDGVDKAWERDMHVDPQEVRVDTGIRPPAYNSITLRFSSSERT